MLLSSSPGKVMYKRRVLRICNKMQGNSSSRILQVTAATWRRESHGLFDYETTHVARNSLRTNVSGVIVRAGDDCHFVPEASVQPLQESAATLAHVEAEGEEFVVLPEAEPHWLIVPRVTGWRLAEGDVVRLGRVRFKVKEMYSPYTTQALVTNLSLDLRPRPSLCASKSEPEIQPELKAQAPCRICLMETYTKNDPLMTPCKCAGTMRYIHLKCLQQWLGSKMTMRQSGNTVSYSWKHLECELCKEPFPLVISLEGRVVELVEMNKPDTPYLILEDERSDFTQGRGLHVISLLENSSVRMGRGHESDLRIPDISVSRCHAIVQLTREGFFITDNRSKFGTLLLARKPVRVRTHDPISIQVNRTVLTFGLREPWGFVKSCLSCACWRRSNSVVAEMQEPVEHWPASHSNPAAVIEVAEAVNSSGEEEPPPMARGETGMVADPLEHDQADARATTSFQPLRPPGSL